MNLSEWFRYQLQASGDGFVWAIEHLPSQFDDQLWHEPRETEFWGTVTLLWVVTKTYQHTSEHIHDVLRMALFWDRGLRQQQAEQESAAGPEG